MADVRPLRVRTKEVNYQEPVGNTGLYKIRADAPPASDSENDDEDNTPKRGVKKVKRGGPGAAKPPRPSNDKSTFSPGDSLFQTIKDRPSAVPMAVSQWWQDYSYRRAFCVEQLANLVVEASGYKGRFPSAAFKEDGDADVDEQVMRLVDNLKDMSPEPHMRGADKQSVKLRKNLDEFWRKFAELAPKEELAEICGNPLCKWIFAMSTAPLREIRQSAVLAGLAVNVGLVSVGADIIQDMSNKHRMLTAAGSSKAGGAAQKEKVQRLQEEVRSLQETKVQLEEQMDTMVNAIFMHRHRDVVPSVRAACIAAMGDIITLCSSKFLNNGYLKYMGWALNDFGDQGGHVVRRAALDAIAQIYAMDPGKELDLFSDRFKKRIVEMRLDRDQRVCESAINVAGMLAKRDLLDDEETEMVYQMIVNDDPEIRRAAAEVIDSVYIKSDLEKAFADEDNKADKTGFMLKGVVELLHQVAGEYEDLESMYDALSDSCEGWGVGDWALMVKTLEDDDDEALMEEQKETLARLLAASLRLAPDDAAAATSAPKGRKSGGGDDASGVSVVLAALPGLVSRLGLNSGILSALLDVVSSIPVSKGLSTKHAKSLGKVVDVVSEAAVKSQDARVVKNAALALSKIASSPPGILALIDSHFAALADTLWKQASTGLASVSKGSRPSAAATMGIKRLAIMHGHIDLGKYRSQLMRDSVDAVTRLSKCDGPNPNSDAVLAAVGLSHAALLWRMSNHRQTEDEDGDEVAEARLELVEGWSALCDASSGYTVAVRLASNVAIADALRHGDMGKGCELLRRKNVVAAAKASKELMLELDPEGEEFEQAVSEVMGYQGVSDALDVYRELAIGMYNGISCTVSSGKQDEDATAEILASLHIGYEPRSSDRDMASYGAEVVTDEVLGGGGRVALMLAAHQKIYGAVLDLVNRKQDESEASKALVLSVSSLQLAPHEAAQYVGDSIRWCMSALPSQARLGFLDMVGLTTSKIAPEDAAKMLNLLEDVCKEKKVSLKEASGALGFVSKLRHKLVEAADGGAWQQPPTRKSPNTPAARTPGSGKGRSSQGTPISAVKMEKLAAADGGDDEEMSQPVGGGKGGKKRSSAGSSASGGRRKSGGKRKGIESDPESEEDEEGFKSTRSSRA